MSCTQLTMDDHIEIYALKKARVNQTEIAKQIGRHKSIIRRVSTRHKTWSNEEVKGLTQKGK